MLDKLEKYKEEVEKRSGRKVHAIMLKGSQNYNLHDVESDVDAIAVVFPSVDDMLKMKEFSGCYKFPGEGEVTVHDIRKFAKIAQKGNPGYIEAIRSEWVIGDVEAFKHLKVNPKALIGMGKQKFKGGQPKDTHHLFRLADLAYTIGVKGEDVGFIEYPCNQWQATLIGIKRGYVKIDEEQRRSMMNSIEEYLVDVDVPVNKVDWELVYAKVRTTTFI